MSQVDAQYLNDLHDNELAPPKGEVLAVQRSINAILGALNNVAEAHPCGSWAKGTMLRGRKEADIVAIMSEAPDARTLGEVARLVGGIEGVSVSQRHKAVEVAFPDGVSVDVLPVAREDRTPPGNNIPRKLRHARSGPAHVQWFREAAGDKPLREVVRLVKRWRDSRDIHLPSFAIEVLAAKAVPRNRGLDAWFTATVAAVRDQFQSGPAHLDDPVVPGSNVLQRYPPADCQRTAEEARAALVAAESGSWSRVFTNAQVAPPGSNLGGRTLG